VVRGVDRVPHGPGVDLTALGGPASASICDHVIQEIDPSDASVVWSWDAYDHIPVTEMDPQWNAGIIAGGPTAAYCGYDVYHWNAIEPTGTGFIVSFRVVVEVMRHDAMTIIESQDLAGLDFDGSARRGHRAPRPDVRTAFGGLHDNRAIGGFKMLSMSMERMDRAAACCPISWSSSTARAATPRARSVTT
jgi:hypothetical protein